MKAFEAWLADLLSQDELEVRALLRDPKALHFLITWSLFESKCFGGFLKLEALDSFASRLVAEHYDSRSFVSASQVRRGLLGRERSNCDAH